MTRAFNKIAEGLSEALAIARGEKKPARLYVPPEIGVKEEKMGVALDEMMDRLPEERRRKVEARASELIDEEMSLRDLRKALGKTQVAVAKKLGMKQENVSRVEQRTDVLLSTLDGYLKALGGRLRLVAEFKGRAPVKLTGFGALKDAHRPKKPANAGKPRRRAA